MTSYIITRLDTVTVIPKYQLVNFFSLQQISLRLTYKLLWPEPRMILNSSADWSEGEINVRGDMVDNFWTPDIIIHDLVSFYKPEVLNQVAALEVKTNKRLYYKVRWVVNRFTCLCLPAFFINLACYSELICAY